MKQELKSIEYDLEKLEEELQDDLKQKASHVKERMIKIIKKLEGAGMELEEMRKEFVDVEYNIWKLEELAKDDMKEKVFKVRYKVAKVIIILEFFEKE